MKSLQTDGQRDGRTDKQTDEQTTDDRCSEKLTLAFNSGELKIFLNNKKGFFPIPIFCIFTRVTDYKATVIISFGVRIFPAKMFLGW